MKIILSSLLTLTIMFCGCRPKPQLNKAEAPQPVKTMEISPELVSLKIHTSGILLSDEELKLSFKTGGIVSKIQVREGENVKKDQVIASLNLSEINAQVNLAASAYDKAVRDFGRVKNLYADSVATLEQFQNAGSALAAAKSQLDIARFNQSHSSIIAPVDGIILKQFVRVNEMAMPGYPAFLFGTSGKSWRVKTGLADRDIVKINPGDSAVVTFDAWPGVKFQAQVDLMGKIANQSTGTYDTELTLGDKGYRFAAGFVAMVDIYPSSRKSYILVPVGAILEADGQSGYIFCLSGSDTVRKTKVNIVTIAGDRAAVTGIPDGISRVVTEGAAYLTDGEKISVKY